MHASSLSSSDDTTSPDSPLRLRETYANKHLLIIGGTGFLGKVWWSLLLDRLPNVGKLYLVVRPRPNVSSSERFWSEIAPHPCLAPLRQRYGEEYEAFLRSKLVPIEGDVTQPCCGLDSHLRDELRGKIDAVVNASGIVNFQPPLDVALEVNAFGAQTLVDLATDLGHVPIVHTSTCYVAGYRTGIVEETDPRLHPFPFAGRLERAHWDPDREIAECLDIIRQAKHRAGDAFRQSHFLDQAKKNLVQRGEPSSGVVLEEEIARVRRRFIEVQLSQLGQERAQFWGWPNTYTYTKSIGEQIIARSGLPFTIVRPAIIESCVDYPCPGWNEGVNTSAPIIYAIRQGQTQLPGDSVRLDLIPCDLVASGMILSLAELLEGRAKPVYQYGASDSNPVTMSRVYELSGLYKRKFYLRTRRGNPLVHFLQVHVEGALMRPKAFEQYGPKRVAKSAHAVADFIDKIPAGGVSLMVEPIASGLRKFARGQERVAAVVGQFVPFTAELDYEFRCDNTRAAYARVLPEEQALLYWQPERLDWRDWFLNTHVPGLERHVFPELEAKLSKPVKPLRRHQTLVHLLGEMSERFEHAVALQHVEEAGLTRLTFADWHRHAQVCARRLQALGIGTGDSVAIAADNHPDYAIALFGILYAGATAVPLPPQTAVEQTMGLLSQTQPKLVLLAQAANPNLGPALDERRIRFVELGSAVADDATDCESALPTVSATMPAVLLHTRGHASKPRPVVLTHEQLTTALSVLAPLFKLDESDRLLAVQPMHSWFELLCGLLLPLSRGTRVVYANGSAATDTVNTLKAAHITAIVGNAAVWKTLLDQSAQVAREGNPLVRRLDDAKRKLTRGLTGGIRSAAGPVLLSAQHQALGGHLRLLINGGETVAPTVSKALGELGLPLVDVYGLTEIGPVCVSPARARRRAGELGIPVPGIEVSIREADATGLGEVMVRRCSGDGAYIQDTPSGDLGRIDQRRRLLLVGRASDGVRTTSGQWLHPGEIENRVGSVKHAAEWAALIIESQDSPPRLACVAVAPLASSVEKGHLLRRVRAELFARFEGLPLDSQPEHIWVRDEPLPRLSSGHLNRERLARQVQRHRTALMAQANTHTEVAPKLLATIRHSFQEVIGTKLELSLRTSLRIDLPLDALQELRVVEALEHDLQRTLDHALFLQCDTISDVVVWLHSRVAQFDTAAVLKKLTPTSSRAQRAAQALLRKATGARGTATRSGIEALSTPRSLVFVADDRAALAQLSRIEKALGPRAGQLSVVVPDTVCPRTSGLNPASSATYVGLRQLLGLTRALLHHGRIPVVLATTAAYDGCRTGLGRLLFETDVDLIPVAVPVGVSSKPERLLLGHSIDGQELRKLLLEREVGDLERAAGAMLSRIFDELRQGRRPLVAELLITRQEADEPLRGTARRPTLERADQVPGLFQDSWSP